MINSCFHISGRRAVHRYNSHLDSFAYNKTTGHIQSSTGFLHIGGLSTTKALEMIKHDPVKHQMLQDGSQREKYML